MDDFADLTELSRLRPAKNGAAWTRFLTLAAVAFVVAMTWYGFEQQLPGWVTLVCKTLTLPLLVAVFVAGWELDKVRGQAFAQSVGERDGRVGDELGRAAERHIH